VLGRETGECFPPPYSWSKIDITELYQEVAAERIIVCSVSGGKESDERIQLVLGEGLEDSGGSDERRDGRGQGGGETAGVDQVPGQRNSTHGLEETSPC
jgi:hypothetical protein